MTNRGTTYGEIDIQHPTTNDYYTIYVRIDYTNEDDTYDTQGSLDWYYEVEWVEDEDGNKYEKVDWITLDMIDEELEQILVNALNN